MHKPIAYTYEAAHHCPSCTIARFGADSHGFPPAEATDMEGNGLGAVFPWDEWEQFTGELETLACDTCLITIDT